MACNVGWYHTLVLCKGTHQGGPNNALWLEDRKSGGLPFGHGTHVMEHYNYHVCTIHYNCLSTRPTCTNGEHIAHACVLVHALKPFVHFASNAFLTKSKFPLLSACAIRIEAAHLCTHVTISTAPLATIREYFHNRFTGLR